jgi:UDP-N-acetylglucosamine--N-acetylmuramyl-(pentapeptide) pyrophosphoryl-undecaprenol N-acetylglucosamine transferase
MKRIVITGGGSAGHVTPNLALIPRLKELGFEVYYAGQKTGIEQRIISTTDVPYYGISAGKLRRYFDLRNILDIFRIVLGIVQSFIIIKKIKPDILFSKGGFVACPLVWACWILRVPVVIHESDITPGLANRLSAPCACHICVSFPDTLQALPARKATHTGIPIREVLIKGEKAKGKKICGFTDSKPIVLVIGGSLGAEYVNRIVRNSLNRLLLKFNVCHLCGRGRVDPALQGRSGYVQFEYLNKEMPHVYAMADITVSRAGATTLFEILELKKPNVLIPLSKKVSRGDQILNAESFRSQGFSHVIMEQDMDEKTLVEGIEKVYANRSTQITAMRMAGSLNAIERVVTVIRDCITQT